MGFTFSWMAWTWPTALFFIFIATLLIGMVIWERFVPGEAHEEVFWDWTPQEGIGCLSLC